MEYRLGIEASAVRVIAGMLRRGSSPQAIINAISIQGPTLPRLWGVEAEIADDVLAVAVGLAPAICSYIAESTGERR